MTQIGFKKLLPKKKMVKQDPYNHKKRYFDWKKRVKNRISDVSKANSDLILKYMKDTELGLNVAINSKKGARSYIRLNTLRDKMVFYAKQFKEQFNHDVITEITEEQLHKFFNDMKTGVLKKKDGEDYRSTSYSISCFKAFWHWHMQTQKKQNNKEIPDITIYLNTKQEKPKWVYLVEEDVRKLCDNAKYDYKVLIWFLFDSGIRAPTGLVNVKISDFIDDFNEVQIRDETSKTFWRRIKLLLCPKIIRKYVKSKNLQQNDYIFKISPGVTNRYLKRLAVKVLGDKKTLAGGKISELTMYDFRHSSACFWLPRYKSESHLKYRFGWKKSEMVHYYTELLEMRDNITQNDLLIDETRSLIEKKLEKSERENQNS